MTDLERLATNSRIREHGRLTKLKRKSQLCRVFRVKVEAKRLYNFALSFMNEHDINDFDTKILTVHTLDKDHQPVTHELQYLGSQMKQSVIQGIKYNIKSLS